MENKEKSMTLEQFRAELETDATKRNETQEVTIKELIAENHKKDEELKMTLQALKQMFDRCYSVHCNGGALCIFCGFKADCKAALGKSRMLW